LNEAESIEMKTEMTLKREEIGDIRQATKPIFTKKPNRNACSSSHGLGRRINFYEQSKSEFFLLFYKNPVLCPGIKLKLQATDVSFLFTPLCGANKATRYAGGGLLSKSVMKHLVFRISPEEFINFFLDFLTFLTDQPFFPIIRGTPIADDEENIRAVQTF
jgi:hypothetical protein